MHTVPADVRPLPFPSYKPTDLAINDENQHSSSLLPTQLVASPATRIAPSALPPTPSRVPRSVAAPVHAPTVSSNTSLATRPLSASIPLSASASAYIPASIQYPTAGVLLPEPWTAHDDLGKFIDRLTHSFLSAPSWNAFIRSVQGPSDFHPTVQTIPHPSAHLLNHFRLHGTPVVLSTKPWTHQQIHHTFHRGPHQSAHLFREFLAGEFLDMLNKQQWILLPYHLVKNLPNLRLSPLGVVPQRDRRPRTIVDYTFFNVNAETLPIAPTDAMQFVRALQRIVQHTFRADPRHGPVYISKLDLSDGFYRLAVRPDDIPKLGVLVPSLTDQTAPPLVAFPLVLPMGWVNSPPFFCSVTETIADLTNTKLTSNATLPHHRLESVAQTPPPTVDVSSLPPLSTYGLSTPVPDTSPVFSPALASPLGYVDVYVDDFIQLAQGNPHRLRSQQLTLLHTLDTVLRPLSPADSPFRTEPASVKKFLKGDGYWSTSKVVLGWLLNTVAGTITLPPHRLARLHDLLTSISPTQQRVSTKQWHRFLGELRSMSMAIPGSRGLFSTLQHAFRSPLDHGRRLRLNQRTKDFLLDFSWLAHDLPHRPIRLAELVPSHPISLGACDASGMGMGGVFFCPTPHLWRAKFSPAVVASLITHSNPGGQITNSDLELAGTVVQHDVIAQTRDIRECTIHNLHDNLAAMYWQRKGSTTTFGPAAYLLRLQSLHQRFHRYLPRHDYIPGPCNTMADDCSRLWNLTDSALLFYFNSTYPQDTPWTLCHPTSQMLSAVTTALSNNRCAPPSFLVAPNHPISIGPYGSVSAPPSTLTLSSAPTKTPSPSSKSSPHATAREPSLPATVPSALAQWRTHSAPWARRSPAWGPRTPV